MTSISIVIAEDQALLGKSLMLLLNSEPAFTILDIAKNGEEAIKFCHQYKPDLVLMDIKMPIMDGVTAAGIIKKELPDTKVLMLTTFDEVNFVREALQAGAEGYLLKAVEPEVLIDGIKIVCNGGTLIPHQLAKALVSQLDSGSFQDEEIELTARELDILKSVANGLSNQDIADKFFLSQGTVKNYISNLYSKLGVKNRTAAIKYWKEHYRKNTFS
jgi:DNA-binding NarL/FixJ family response regulator